MFRHAGNFSKAELVSGIRPGVFESLSVFDHMVKQRTFDQYRCHRSPFPFVRHSLGLARHTKRRFDAATNNHLDMDDTFEVTASRRPVLLPGEVEIRKEANVSLYQGESKVTSGGAVTITTQRIIFQGPDANVACPLESVVEIQERTPWMGKSKLLLFFSPPRAGVVGMACVWCVCGVGVDSV